MVAAHSTTSGLQCGIRFVKDSSYCTLSAQSISGWMELAGTLVLEASASGVRVQSLHLHFKYYFGSVK